MLLPNIFIERAWAHAIRQRPRCIGGSARIRDGLEKAHRTFRSVSSWSRSAGRRSSCSECFGLLDEVQFRHRGQGANFFRKTIEQLQALQAAGVELVINVFSEVAAH